MLLGGDCPAQVLDPSAINERGFWESPQINAINNELLGQARTNWHSIRPLADDFFTENSADAIRAVVNAQFADARRPVIKDPRICRLAGVWSKALSPQVDRMIFPMIVRNPAEVAASLTARNHFSAMQGMLLWARYNLDAEHATRDRARGMISYAGLLSDWRSATEALEKQIGEKLVLATGASDSVDAFISPELHRQKATGAVVEEYPLLRDTWDIFAGWAEKGRLAATSKKRLDALRQDLDRMALITDEILENNRVLEKRQTENKRRQDGDLGAIAEMQERSLKVVEDLDGRLSELLRLSDKRLAGRLKDVLEEGRQDRELLRTSSERHRDDASVLREELAERQRELSDLRVTNAEIKGAASQLEARVEELARLLARSTADIDAERSARAEADSLVAKLRDDAERQREKLDELTADHEAAISEKETELLKAGDDRDRFRSDLHRTVTELEETRSQLAGVDAELRLARERHLQLEQDHAALQSRRKSVQDELKDVTRKYRTTQATLARTKAGLDNARSRLAASEAETAEQAAEVLRLRSMWHMRAIAALLALVSKIAAPFIGSGRTDPRHAVNLVSASGLFDETWYEDRYPDVRQTGIDPLEHFMAHGWQENRDPGPDFSVSRYLRENADVAEAGCNPLVHYIEFGQAEGRGARKSKLAGRAQAVLPAFALPAPVYRPEDMADHAPAATEPLVPATATFDELRASAPQDSAAAASLARFEVFLGGLTDGARTASWPEGRDTAPSMLSDCWFTNERSIRLRFGQSMPQALSAFQVIGGTVEALAVTAARTGEIAEIKLLSPVHPLLIAGSDGSDLTWASLLTFPSVLRGGLHHPEFLAELAKADPSADFGPFDFSCDLSSGLAASRDASASPAVARLAIDVTGATGTGKLFDPVVRNWLRDMFDLPIDAIPGDHDAGEAYLATAVAQDGTSRPGGTLELPADMLPSLGLLCAPKDQDAGHAVEAPLAMAHLYGVHDDSQPGLAVLLPPIPLRLPQSAMLNRCSAQPRLRESGGFRRHPGPAAIKRIRTAALSDGELLFPVSAALALTGYEPEAIRMVLDCSEADEASALSTLEALAMQSCASVMEIAILHPVTSEIGNRANSIFTGRVSEHDTWADAIADCEPVLCGTVRAGTVLHDWRTLSVLGDFVTSGAATASCPLVASTRAGKGWTTRIVDNGLVAERPGDAYADAIIRTSSAIWGFTYPVRAPIDGLWLASTDKLARWSGADTHRLDRADGEHWCTALTSATSLGDPAGRTTEFEPPIADPACFTSVRVYKG